MSFHALGIDQKILSQVDFEHPTEIQAKSIPDVLAGKDVIAESATGSGKTFAFGVGVLQAVKRGGGVQALILTPTRELAHQVSDSIKKFAKSHPCNILCIYGGVGYGPQVDGIRRADVIVGTPGRILDHLSQKTLDLRHVKVLVLD